jgi:hybrid cluster-associated redox disulfide protein
MKTTKKSSKTAKKTKQIHGKMTFAEVLNKHPKTADVFFKNGMSCFGCPASMMENVEDGIKAHGKDVKKIIDELNKAIKQK